MKIKERLLESKIKLGIKSDYALAKKLEISTQRLSNILKGTVRPEAYEAVKIGEILKIHPLMLLAEFEAEKAKTVERRAFWENFAQRIKTGAVGMLALISTAFWLPEAKAADLAGTAHNVYYVKS